MVLEGWALVAEELLIQEVLNMTNELFVNNKKVPM